MKWLKRKRGKATPPERQKSQGTLGESLQELMDGKLMGERIIWGNIRFLVFITALVVIYIYNRNTMEKLYMRRSELNREVKEARFESLTNNSELMKISSRSEVARRVQQEGLELETSKEPPVQLIR
jgi:hypothetical protein